MDDELLITATVAQPVAYSAQIELEEGENALFMDFQLLKVNGDLTLSYWIEETIEGMSWKVTDTGGDGTLIAAGDTGRLMSSVLGGVIARAGFQIEDAEGGGGDVTLRVTLNPTRR